MEKGSVIQLSGMIIGIPNFIILYIFL